MHEKIIQFTAKYLPYRKKTKFSLFLTLNTQIANGSSLSAALNSLSTTIFSPRIKYTLAMIVNETNQGIPFIQSISKYPNLFPRDLVQLFKTMQEHISTHRIFSIYCALIKYQSSFFYDVILVNSASIGSALATLVLSSFLTEEWFRPWLIDIYKAGDDPIPSLKLYVMQYDFIIFYIIGTLFVCVLLPLLLNLFRIAPIIKVWIDRLAYYMPISGFLLKLKTKWLFNLALGNLMEAGLTLQDSFRLSGQTISNTVIQKKHKDANDSLQQGYSFAAAINNFTLWTKDEKISLKDGQYSLYPLIKAMALDVKKTYDVTVFTARTMVKLILVSFTIWFGFSTFMLAMDMLWAYLIPVALFNK